VRKVQSALGIAADGVFGAGTEQAVKRFQKRKGLAADGVVGSDTRDALGLEPFARGSVERQTSSVKLPRTLRLIAECESGGNPRALSPGGQYRGKYQFSLSTWRNIGGDGDPVDAPEAEQDRLALKLYRRSGAAPWPNCP
jgi:peptidoglycan hydrolase-like protein with peptidoglycan-binding domain